MKESDERRRHRSRSRDREHIRNSYGYQHKSNNRYDRRRPRSRTPSEEKQHKKGRGFMKYTRPKSALHGWEDEDYEETQRKLKLLADKLSGKNRP